MTEEDLFSAVVEIDRHVAVDGWDQPPLLYALVSTQSIRENQPHLAAKLGLDDSAPPVTTFEQESPAPDADLGEFLASISWPDEVCGAVVVVERIVLPPTAEAEVVATADPVGAARSHPAREDVRMVVAVGREGARMCAIRLRSADSEDQVRTGADLVPGLSDALAATFQ